jgi:hypothetical protein
LDLLIQVRLYRVYRVVRAGVVVREALSRQTDQAVFNRWMQVVVIALWVAIRAARLVRWWR